MIILRNDQIKNISRHGESDYPHECCGMIFGVFDEQHRKVAGELHPISNAREETAKRNRFLITADEFIRGESAARKKKLDIIGFYHSHPDHPALPSAFDLEHAWPLYSYVIVAIQQGVAGDLTSWELESDRSKFISETIIRENN
jgi:proteasome lid subunit RPN8/RPN11